MQQRETQLADPSKWRLQTSLMFSAAWIVEEVVALLQNGASHHSPNISKKHSEVHNK